MLRIGLLELCEDLAPAGWVRERLGPFARSVTSIVPEGFPAYARVFHPASHVVTVPGTFRRDERLVRWSEIAAAGGREVHPEMQFTGISGVDPLREESPLPQVWNTMPAIGNLPADAAARLVALLRRHTATPQRCWFAVWDGWGGLAIPRDAAPRFETPGRAYYLLRGPIEGATQTMGATHPLDGSMTRLYRRPTRWERLRAALPGGRGQPRRRPVAPGPPGSADDAAEPASGEAPGVWQSVNLWWPDDRAWLVATEIDFVFTYVGGSAAAVADVLADAGLEALPAQPDDRVTEDGDRRNPPPAGR